MELTPSGMFQEFNKLPWDKFTDKQRTAAISKTCGLIYREMKGAGVRLNGRRMTDAERRDELVSFFDEKLQNRELSAAEVREMVSLCGLDRRTQDITLEVVDFSKVDWENQKSDAGIVEEIVEDSIEAEQKEEESDADTPSAT